MNAETPVMDGFSASGPNQDYTTLDASGLSVGLPDGLMGNSEVGHLNIGAGRVVYQVWFIQAVLLYTLPSLLLTLLPSCYSYY